MSHEIRTPMNGILGFADLLKEPGLTGEEQKDYIAIIEKSGRRLLNIINQIIDISKIEAGLMKIDISESDLNEQISYIFDFFRHEAESKGIKLFLEIPVADKAPILNTDREKVYAILTNLVKNAIKFTEKGAIVLGYDWVQSNDYNPYIQFYVKDSGIGIPEDRQEAIFERFIQADISDKMAFQGAGLGLAIAKAYVEMLGGKIWVESEAGLGSTFYFTLPHLDPDKSLTKTAQQQTKPTGRSKLGKKSKILLLDDEVLSDSLLSVFLRESCSSVLYAPKGLEAIEICRQHPDIDLILMNINITGMDGLETTRRIREINQDVVIIALSDRPPPYDPSEVLKAGCNRFCLKPVNHSEWLQLLQKTLKR